MFLTPSLLPKMSQIKGMKKLGFKNDPLLPFRTKVQNFALYFFEGVPKYVPMKPKGSKIHLGV